MICHDKQKDFLWGALVGGAVATLSVMLFTTKKGKQLQRKIGDVYEDVEESVKDAFFKAKDKVEETAEEAEESAEKVGKKAAHKAKHD